jgi:hypothetical protein
VQTSAFQKLAYELGFKLATEDWLPGKFRQKEKAVDLLSREMADPRWAMQPKIDGVGVAVRLMEGSRPIVYTAEPKKTGPREHTEKLREFAGFKVPGSLHDTVFRAELFAVDRAGKPLPSKDIVGLVNASPAISVASQEARGVTMKLAPLSVIRFKGEDVSGKPYREHVEMLKQIQMHLPKLQELPTAVKPEEKVRLLEEIKKGRNSLTSEGVVFHNMEHGKERSRTTTTKVKFRPDYDVHVRSIFPAGGSREGTAGGFEFSHSAQGPIAGRVGTGFDLALARDMMRNPEKYIGRVAKVRSQQKFESGALRAPSFQEWHLEKGKTVEP